jgi:hypothetical protein
MVSATEPRIKAVARVKTIKFRPAEGLISLPNGCRIQGVRVGGEIATDVTAYQKMSTIGQKTVGWIPFG